MKIGNQYSELLDNFTKNYGEMVKTIISEHHKYEHEEKTATYDDFLDKFAVQELEKRKSDTIREQIFKFVTTEANRDNNICELILRKIANQYKMKLTHYSGSFDYAAFQSVWCFQPKEAKLANRIFDTVAFVLNGIKQDYNKTQKHSVNIVPVIREAIKPIAETHQYKKNILSLDEANLQQGETNWEKAIYGNKYPNDQEQSHEKLMGNHEKANITRTTYKGRNTKIIREI